ncbi:AfsR/SARP family transcriptional regulator [Kineosporia succinea]|uniref:ATPase/DNA-binding SARP family transcriptional activator n=1 Tax=Kineosporia succinea TaxID=84632 RepID=A0ABT9PCE2_9ACTN|nr:BTAD domain-containing putative transcriptional regulator [Kineosporia succinea]MDP9830379.1 putative ATPase/DNA-binding SARP family transcriptional activator [Kineosporia succinea]
MLTFAVLGPLAASDEGRPIQLGGRLQRRLLTMLLAADGQAVSEARLAEGVWEGSPPGDPAGSLQVYVSRLRRVLPGADLFREGGGYRLNTSTSDAGQFLRLVAESRALMPAGRAREAHECFERALGLWRGEPYADGPDDPELAAARSALIEYREGAREDSAAALLAAGEHAGAAAVLEALVRGAPYRERRWQLLALALYRAGRQADALAALRRVRTLLAEELGVDPGPELQQLEHRILAQDPQLQGPVAPAEPGPGRPRPLSSFVGRAGDLAVLDQLVAAHRTVTVVGPAGAGKTRLVTEWAQASAAACAVIRLADVTDPALLMSAVGEGLGLPGRARDLRESVVQHLNSRPGPLVLDNCEHLSDDVARFVIDLLVRVPALRVVATSRTALGVDGEHILPLGPLTGEGAVALLIDRIRAVRPGWAPGPDDHQDLRHLADALDRLPLALELAAARARILSVRELTAHLGDRFALLGPIPHGTMTPHATLRAAIGWSFDLLAGPERDLAVSLWPYEGGFPLQAAGFQVGALAALVDQSVVTADISNPAARYRMLETIRAYCTSIDKDPQASRRAHAGWARDLVTRAAQDLQGEAAPSAMARLRLEMPNIRAAIAHDLADDPGAALRTSAQLMWFWIRSGLLAEGRTTITAALAAAPHAPLQDVVRARAALSGLLYTAGETAAARDVLAEAARAVDAGPGDALLLAELRYYEALAQLPEGDAQIAVSAASEANAQATGANVAWLMAATEMALGAALVLAGRTATGQQRLGAAVHRGLACGSTWTAALSELMLAQTLVGLDNDRALRLLRSSLRRFRAEDDLTQILAVLHNGALALEAAGDPTAVRLRDVVHFHRLRDGIQPAGTYIHTVMPAGWYEGPAPQRAASLDDVVLAFEGAVDRHVPRTVGDQR